jgi:ABC-type phosphate/phosphonate transport system substrate-binding protein
MIFFKRDIVSVMALSLSLLAPSALACDKPITIAYGPYVTLLMVNQFLVSAHEELEAETGCEVKYTLFDSFDGLIESIVKKEHAMAGVPGSYTASLQLIGYEQVATLDLGENDSYLVVHKNSEIESLENLSGKKVMFMGGLSESGASLLRALKDTKVIDAVVLENKSSYENMLISLIRKEVDAVMVVTEYWRLLSKNIRESSLRILYREPGNLMDYIVQTNNEVLKVKFRNALRRDAKLKWIDPEVARYRFPAIEAHIADVIKEHRVRE